MNRTGLFVTLAIAALVGLVFGSYPAARLEHFRLFFDPAKKDFMLRWNPLLIFLRDAAMWVVTVVAAPAFIALAIKLLRPRGKLLIAGRALVFLIATLALAPGLVTNVVLKDYWPRSRPIDVPQFNGERALHRLVGSARRLPEELFVRRRRGLRRVLDAGARRGDPAGMAAAWPMARRSSLPRA